MASTLEPDTGRVDLDEAMRQLAQATHDAQVAFDCISLGDLDRAHTNAITARAAVDAAEQVLRTALDGEIGGEPLRRSGISPRTG